MFNQSFAKKISKLVSNKINIFIDLAETKKLTPVPKKTLTN